MNMEQYIAIQIIVQLAVHAGILIAWAVSKTGLL
jgi:hypothetical protein